MPLSLSNASLSLVGLGVRTVSFLRVKVYSAGFYLEESALHSLASQSEWKVSEAISSAVEVPADPRFRNSQSFTADRLTKATPVEDGEIVGEELMEKLLNQPVNCAIRIGKEAP